MVHLPLIRKAGTEGDDESPRGMNPLDNGIDARGQSSEGAREPMRRLVLAAPTRHKVSTDTIVQWIRLYESGVIASVFCVSRPIES
jgi:hypothetical protein